MSYKLTNKSGGQLVCDLAVKGKTLRLNNGKSTVIKDNEITKHIENLVKKRLLLSEKVYDTKATATVKKEVTAKSSDTKEKEKEE